MRISASRAAFVASVLAIGCDSATINSGPLVASVRLSKDTATLVPTQRLALTATPFDAHGNVVVGLSTTWSSNAPSVATVAQDGIVTGVAAGIAVVTGTIAGRSSVMRLTVYDGAVIGPAGGIAATPDSAIVLRVPVGALVDTRQITIVPTTPTLPIFVTAVGRAYDLGPVETTFAQLASLRLRYQSSSLPTGAAESSVRVARLTSIGPNFALFLLPGSTVDPVRHEITVPVSAFSLWVPVVATTPVP
jgi:Big-like domain-containing protein